MPEPVINEKMLNYVLPLLNALRLYHQHEVVGMEHMPASGKVLLVVNHSLATYDIALLFAAIYEDKHRLARPIADHLFFKIPYLDEMVAALGVVDGTYDNAKELLAQGELVGVAPGGMREALRPSSQRYQILWERRRGFARLALETGTPIVLAVCPRADDLYDVYPTRLTAWAYKKFKVPLFFARGLGLSPLPRPIKLVHFLSEPLAPPPAKESPREFDEQLTRFHRKVIKRAERLIGEAIAYRHK